MKKEEINAIISGQRDFFESGVTLQRHFRLKALLDLKRAIIEAEQEILDALSADLGKSAYESYMCEVGLCLSEISYMIKNLRKFMKKCRVKTPLAQFPSKSYTMPSPYGNTLIMSPWNYPFLLSITPLANSIAAGNTVILKPSAYSPSTSKVIEKIISRVFEAHYVACITGGREENSHLLDTKFDFIFFTGSTSVGREVLRHAAETLTPAVLELGGKSPCIVDNTAKIALAARRIVFGKFINCGQTCVAPDYVLCQKDIKDMLVAEIIKEIKLQYGENPLGNADYGKIVNKKHFTRLTSLINREKTVIGGEYNEAELKIAPTVLSDVNWDDAIMKEEIFGPILPILIFEKFDDLYESLKDLPKPLAFYYFTEDMKSADRLMEKCSFGGGCINDTIIHLATSEMGFGGVGESGMGSYHGKAGFDAFSHRKSIVKKSTRIDLPMRYQPYNSKFERLIRLFLK